MLGGGDLCLISEDASSYLTRDGPPCGIGLGMKKRNEAWKS